MGHPIRDGKIIFAVGSFQGIPLYATAISGATYVQRLWSGSKHFLSSYQIAESNAGYLHYICLDIFVYFHRLYAKKLRGYGYQQPNICGIQAGRGILEEACRQLQNINAFSSTDKILRAEVYRIQLESKRYCR